MPNESARRYVAVGAWWYNRVSSRRGRLAVWGQARSGVHSVRSGRFSYGGLRFYPKYSQAGEVVKRRPPPPPPAPLVDTPAPHQTRQNAPRIAYAGSGAKMPLDSVASRRSRHSRTQDAHPANRRLADCLPRLAPPAPFFWNIFVPRTPRPRGHIVNMVNTRGQERTPATTQQQPACDCGAGHRAPHGRTSTAATGTADRPFSNR